MAKIRFQSLCQYEYDTETGRTRVISAFTKPIGEAGKNRQRGRPKVEAKGAKTSGEVTL